jgi:hypothetical protein
MDFADEAIAEWHLAEKRQAEIKRGLVVCDLRHVIIEAGGIRGWGGLVEDQVLDVGRCALDSTRENRLLTSEGSCDQPRVRQHTRHSPQFPDRIGRIGEETLARCSEVDCRRQGVRYEREVTAIERWNESAGGV